MATTDTGGLSAFLTDGAKIPSGSAVKSLTSQTVLPEWYTNYAMQILSNQGAIGAGGYTPYQGPQVAGFTPQQQQGFAGVNAAAGAYQPALGAATTTTQNILAGPGGMQAASGWMQQGGGLATRAAGMSGLGAAQPYLDSAAAADPLATAQPYFSSAGNMVSQGANPIGLNTATPWLNQAGGLDAAAAANPYFSQALGSAQTAMQSGGGLAAAQPYLDSASGNTTDVGDYMDPYLTSVVDRVGELGARTLREKMLPEIRDKYIASGNWDGSGQMTDTARALRDISADVSAQQSQLMSTGYQRAVEAALADKARYGQLGATAGALGTDFLRSGLDAAGLAANVGSQVGGLTQGRQNALTNLGQTFGNLGQQQQQIMMQGAGINANLGQMAGGLDLSRAQLQGQLGATAGQLRGQDASTMLNAGKTLADIGVSSGNMVNADRTLGLNGAGQLAEMGGLAQSMGLTGAGAQIQAGNQQQALDQKNLDVTYANYLRQMGYPQEQIDQMVATLKGIAPAVPTGTLEQGIVPSGVQPEYKPGTAATIASALAGAGGLVSAFGGL